MAEIRHSVCALDCPDCCSLLVTVENDRGTKLRGNPDHPITRGFLCGKVAQYLEREYSPSRLLYPQKRVGAKGEGRFQRIGWDEALDTIARRLQAIAAESSPESILPYSYAGTMGYLNGSGMDRRFFHRLGASQLDRTICSSAGMAGMTEALGLRYSTCLLYTSSRTISIGCAPSSASTTCATSPISPSTISTKPCVPA